MACRIILGLTSHNTRKTNDTRLINAITVIHDFALVSGIKTVTTTGAPCYLTKFRDSCHLNSFTYAANGRCPERPASVTTTHKSRFVITPSNGWTDIRNAILASRAIAHFGSANCPAAYQGLKIFTSLALRFPDFQRRCKKIIHLK